MTSHEITYADLFTFLAQLGFHDTSPSPSERVFEHPESGIVLAFAMLDDPSTHRPVRSADLRSTEFRLQYHAFVAGPLHDAIQHARHTSG